MPTYFLHPASRWHAWNDGIVLFAPGSAETVLLGSDVLPLLDALAQSAGFTPQSEWEEPSGLLDALVALSAVRIIA